MPAMTAAIDCRQASPTELIIEQSHLPAMRVTVGRGWWEIWDGQELYARIPPNRHCLARAVTACWRSHTSGFWEVPRPMPRFRSRRAGGGDPAAALTPLQVCRAQTLRLTRHLTGGVLAPLQTALAPTVLDVWRRLATCAPLPMWPRDRCAPMEEWFWDHPYLARDVLAIRGAAFVVRSLMETYDDPESLSAWEALQEGDWQRACCPGRHVAPYRALRVTLSNCPGRLPVHRLSILHLRGIGLPRPRRTRLELIAAMAVGRHVLAQGNSPNLRVVLEADDQQLQRALPLFQHDLFGEAHRVPYTQRAYLVSDLLDYPEPCADLDTLARCAAEWHATGCLPQEEATRPSLSLDPSTPTAAPPRELPAPCEPGVSIRRLATVGEVISEGEQMQHCVGRYAARAQAGACFLYHINVDGEAATIELNRQLRLVQARGPRNAANRATRYAERLCNNHHTADEVEACAPF